MVSRARQTEHLMMNRALSKPFIELSIDEMSEIISSKEPSLEKLEKKALILMRSAMVAISRIQVVADIEIRPSEQFFKEIYKILSQLASITITLNTLLNSYKKTPVDAGVNLTILEE